MPPRELEVSFARKRIAWEMPHIMYNPAFSFVDVTRRRRHRPDVTQNRKRTSHVLLASATGGDHCATSTARAPTTSRWAWPTGGAQPLAPKCSPSTSRGRTPKGRPFRDRDHRAFVRPDPQTRSHLRGSFDKSHAGEVSHPTQHRTDVIRASTDEAAAPRPSSASASKDQTRHKQICWTADTLGQPRAGRLTCSRAPIARVPVVQAAGPGLHPGGFPTPSADVHK